MLFLNKSVLAGNVGADPVSRTLPDGRAACTISMATTESWKDKRTGEWKERTEWHRVSFTDGLAEVVVKYVAKGRPIYVEGSLRTNKWTDKAGVDRYITEIRANVLKFMGKNPGEKGSAPTADDQGGGNDEGPSDSEILHQQAGGDFDDDIPF